MAEKPLSWAAWGWIALLGLMLLVPLAGIVLGHVAAVAALLFPLLIGGLVGLGLTLAALFLRHYTWWGPASLVTVAVTAILFHRQLTVVLLGTLLGATLALLRRPLLRWGARAAQWWQAWRGKRPTIRPRPPVSPRTGPAPRQAPPADRSTEPPRVDKSQDRAP